MREIPVLSLREFAGSESQRLEFARRMGDALAELGFFALEDHGVDEAVLSRAYAAISSFFELDVETKEKYEDLDLKGQRGFTSFGREHAKDHPAPDLKEFWHVGRELPANHTLGSSYLANLWPKEVPDFQPALLDLYSRLDACAQQLLEAVSLYCGVEPSLFPDMARNGNTILRLIHYPPIPETAPAASMRAAPHEDINLITLLCGATAGGLEILTRDGEWIGIQAVPGQIVVDAGDMLQNATNGLLRSTTHRVVNPDSSRERRFSMPFFVHPRSEVDLTPQPKCVAQTGGDVRYPSLTAGEYLLQRLREIGLA